MECLHPSWQGQAGQTPEMHSSHCKWTWKIQHWHSSLKWDQASRRGQTLWMRHRLHLLLEWTWTWRKTRGWSWLCCEVNACWHVGWPPKGVNDHLMMMRLPFSNGQKFITIVSAYAPTMTNPDEVKDKLYEDLNTIITTVPNTDNPIILGDFNAKAGSDSITWEGVIGQYGVGNCNSNGLLLLQTCAEHGLLITNTVFCLPTQNRTSWMPPCSKHWHLIDYVIIRKRDRQDVQVTRAMCGAECWTDHCLIISKLSLCIQPKRCPQGM